jgi:histidyl-tRNA synthetase
MDADIFGSASILCEVELLDMAKSVLENIGFTDFYIHLNNRKILDAQVRCAGISEKKKTDVFRALDKLSKIGYEGVRQEFLNRGLSDSEFEKFMSYIIENGTNSQKLDEMRNLLENDVAGVAGVAELFHVLELAKNVSLDEKIIVDYTLVRGLDYYTGPIFEIKIKGQEIGSVVGGGRYDQLIELFGGGATPAVGISFGIERIIDLIEKNATLLEKYQGNPPLVYILFVGQKALNKALNILQTLRRSGVPADIDLMGRSFDKQMRYANGKGYPYLLIVGEREIERDMYGLKDMKTGKQLDLTVDAVIREVIRRKNNVGL